MVAAKVERERRKLMTTLNVETSERERRARDERDRLKREAEVAARQAEKRQALAAQRAAAVDGVVEPPQPGLL